MLMIEKYQHHCVAIYLFIRLSGSNNTIRSLCINVLLVNYYISDRKNKRRKWGIIYNIFAV